MSRQPNKFQSHQRKDAGPEWLPLAEAYLTVRRSFGVGPGMQMLREALIDEIRSRGRRINLVISRDGARQMLGPFESLTGPVWEYARIKWRNNLIHLPRDLESGRPSIRNFLSLHGLPSLKPDDTFVEIEVNRKDFTIWMHDEGAPAFAGVATAAATQSRCEAWLRRRRHERGDELKKTLLHAAKEEIDGLTTRIFDAAYPVVYRRKQGRPEASVSSD